MGKSMRKTGQIVRNQVHFVIAELMLNKISRVLSFSSALYAQG